LIILLHVLTAGPHRTRLCCRRKATSSYTRWQ